MRRRGVMTIVVLALGILAAPLAAEAQPPAKVWRIGLFHVGLDHVPPSLEGLREGLAAPQVAEARDGPRVRVESDAQPHGRRAVTWNRGPAPLPGPRPGRSRPTGA
jgi:hypothetical protein